MLGQIRSYISYIDENSSDDYINRINNMISSLPDTNEKTNIINELNNKLNEIKMIKKYKKPVEEIKPIVEVAKEQTIIPQENFEDEIAKKIKEYQQYQENKKDSIVVTNLLPNILISATNLIRLGMGKHSLYKTSIPYTNMEKEKSKVIGINNGIPSLEIINDETA